MSQNHLSLDFPIKTPASARALNEELPPLMPNFAKVLDHLGTVHFSRFMVKGDKSFSSFQTLTVKSISTSNGW